MTEKGSDLLHKLVLMVAGFALTGVLGTYVTYRLENMQREQAEAAALAVRRAKHGQEIEDLVLRETSQLVQKLREARNLAVNHDPQSALKFFNEDFLPAKRNWDRQIYQIRNQVGRSFGSDAAMMIYHPNSRNLEFDLCGVLAERGTQVEISECAKRLYAEVEGLDAAIQALNAGTVSDKGAFDILWPEDFTASLRVSRELLQRLIDCKQGVDSDNAKRWGPERFAVRCGNLSKLAQNLNQRVNLTGVSQEALADQFLAVWTSAEAHSR